MKKIVFSVFLAITSLQGWAYGVDVAKALRHEVEATCVPINSMMLRMCQPDGQVRRLLRQPNDDSTLTGEGPWIGVVRQAKNGQIINVLTSPEFKGEKTEYCFLNGHLRFMSVGKKDYEFKPQDYSTPTNTIVSLWPDHAEMNEQDRAQADIWRGGGRLRLISRNPNRTSLLLAEVVMIALGVVFFASSHLWRLHGALWTFIAVILLFQTQSRGGFLALLGGVSVHAFFRWHRGVSKKVVVLCALGALLVGGFAVVSRTGDRMTKGTVAVAGDHSAQGRLAMWREVPRMLAAAPFGCGLWKSGPTYNSWFERQDRLHTSGDLFNDHLSRFVEGGFVFGGLYVFAWSLLLLASAMFAWKGGSPIPLAVWLVYFIASAFNPMNFWGPSFYIPLAVTAWSVWRMCKTGFWASGEGLRSSPVRIAIGAVVLTVVTLAGAAACAMLTPKQDIPLRIKWLGRQVIAGKGEPKVWVVEDGFVLDGNYFGFPGREIREFYRVHPNAEALGLVNDISSVPKSMQTLVLAGRACESYLELPANKRPRSNCLVFFSPSLKYDKILEKLESQENVHVVLGEFVAMLEGGVTSACAAVHIVPGAELYIPGWLESVVAEKGEEIE